MNRNDAVKIALDLIRELQENPAVHPMTCGHDSSHPPLVGDDIDRAVQLRCVACDWTQALPTRIAGLILDRIRERVR